MFRSSLQLLLSSCLLIVLRCSPLGPPGGRWRVLLTGLLSSFLLATTYLTLTRLHPRLSAAILMLTVPVVTILSSITNKYEIKEGLRSFRIYLKVEIPLYNDEVDKNFGEQQTS